MEARHIRRRALLTSTLLAIGVQLLHPTDAAPACGAGDLAVARAAIEAACGCPTAGGHGAYVQCAKAAVASPGLKPCRGPAIKCAAKSTCGTARVRCCRTTAKGKTKCSIRSSTTHCRAAKGGSATPGAGSCCDCVARCGNGVLELGEECDPPRPNSPACPGPGSPTGAFLECSAACTCPAPTTTTTTTSTTTTTISTACGDTYAQCNGSCPPGMQCWPEENFPPTSCACFPAGVVPCSSSAYPECGGTCSGSAVCAPVAVFSQELGSFSYCTCLDPTATCSGSFQGTMCPGVCPAGTVCYGEPDPGELGNCVGCLPSCLPNCVP